MKYFLVATLLIQSGCALFRGHEGPNYDYFTNLESKAPLKKIENNLKKENTNAGKRYSAHVLPLTPVILKKRFGKPTLEHFNLSNDKICVEIDLIVSTKEKELEKSFWTAKIKNVDKKETTLEWMFPEKNKSRLFYKPGPYGPKKHWTQSGVMCSKDRFNFKNNFEVVLISKDVPFPFSKEMSFKWDMVQNVIVDGKKVPAKTIYQKRRYRGW